MAKRRLIKACAILFLLSPNPVFASTAWLAGENEYTVGLSSSYVTSYDKDIYLEVEKYTKLQRAINSYELKIHETKGKNTLPDYVLNQRIRVYQEKINSLKERQNLLQKDFLKATQNLYIERGISPKYSFGVSLGYGSSMGLIQSRSQFFSGEVFLKRKLFENKKWIISCELGVKSETYKGGTSNITTRFNGAYIKKYRNGRKQITEMSIGALMSSPQSTVTTEIRESLEFVSGYIIQLSSYSQYDGRLNPGYRYFFRDQVTIAKKISTDILPILEKSILSIGLYQDYFHKNRKKAGKGIYGGLWIRL